MDAFVCAYSLDLNVTPAAACAQTNSLRYKNMSTAIADYDGLILGAGHNALILQELLSQISS